MKIHEAASAGFSSAADAYERGRPSYPEACVDAIARELGVAPGRTVVDLGAGTGKLTRLLAPFGAELVAIEPVAAMRAKLVASLPDVRALEGTAEAIPLADASADSVVVAQAFHWFDGDRALAEIRRVLRPGGALGLVWNQRDESIAWVRRATELLDARAGDAPTYRSGAWRAAFARSNDFTPLVEHTSPWTQEVDERGLDDRFGSVSYVAAMSAPARDALLAEIRALARAALTDEDARAPRPVFRIPYRTSLFVCKARAR